MDRTDEDRRDGLIELAPAEIVEYELPRAKRGYDRAEVDDLLDRLAAQTARLLDEVERARARANRLRGQLDEVSEVETTLKRTLLTAQRAADSSIKEAHDQAGAIRERAVSHARTLLERAVEEARELRETAARRARAEEAEGRRRRRALDEHVEQLRSFATDHRTRVTHHLEQQLERLGAMALPPAPPEPPTSVDEVVAADDDLDVDIDVIVAGLEDGLPDDADVVVADTDGSEDDDGDEAATGGPTASSDDGPSEDALALLLARVDGAAAEVRAAAADVAQVDDEPLFEG